MPSTEPRRPDHERLVADAIETALYLSGYEDVHTEEDARGPLPRHRVEVTVEGVEYHAIIFRADDSEGGVAGHRCLLRDHVGTHLGFPDGRSVEVPRCFGVLSSQHLCIGHNRFCEDEPDAAKALVPSLLVREVR